MEILLKQQNTLATQIQQIVTNYKKDSDIRKTNKYLEKRKQDLTALIKNYSANHEQIIILQGANENLPYFTERRTLKTAWEAILDDITKRQENALDTPTEKQPENQSTHQALVATNEKNTSSNITSETSKSDIQKIELPNSQLNNNQPKQKLLDRQFVRINHQRGLISQANNTLEQHKPKEYLIQKIQQLKSMVAKIDDLHEEILLEITQDDLETNEYFLENMYFIISEVTEDCIARLQQAINNEEQLNRPTVKNETKLKLPKIQIPFFYGDYNKWMAFHDLFKKLIHENEDLSDTHKMSYLKSHTNGQAAKIISHLDTIGDNYNAAWNLMESRYNNKRLLVSTQLTTLLNQNNLTTESANGIRNLHDTIKDCMHAIRNLGINTDNWDVLIIHLMTKKLDNETIRLYESSLQNPKETQRLSDFLQFLEQRFNTLQALQNQRNTRAPNSSGNSAPKIKGFLTTTTKHCKRCSGQHHISYCQKFIKLSSLEKNQLVNLLNLCRNCLSEEHNLSDCKAINECSNCSGRHHTLLHSSNEAKTSPTTKAKTSEVATFSTEAELNVLLGTAIVRATSQTGKMNTLRVLIDPGSQATFITENAADRLRLKKSSCYAKIKGMASADAGDVIHKTQLRIQPRFSSSFSLDIKPLIINNIAKNLPDKCINPERWSHIQNLLWADPTFCNPGPIDMLIGADKYTDIVLGQIIKGNTNEPLAQNSELGWIIMGKFTSNLVLPKQINAMISTIDIDKQLRQFWEIEEVQSKGESTQEDVECENFYRENYRRREDGRYEVRIPFKDNNVKQLIGSTKAKATARLLQIERQFQRNETFKEMYINFMNDFITLNHMEKISTTQQSEIAEVYYMPHHGVLKESSTTTKLRVVFDASAKSDTGTSLNDLMMVGPTVQDNLFSILLRWRKHRYAFTADVEKMFRQINMHTKDQQFQQILWRPTISEPIQAYKLKTVTYGTAAANFLATRTLHQLAMDEQERYPIAASITQSDFYVDDLLSGADTIKDALEAQAQLIDMFKSGGFNLRKWASSSSILRTAIPRNNREVGLHQIDHGDGDTIKTLGIAWNPRTDNFEFSVKLEDIAKPPSKRCILSETSKLFDPLGWLSPVIINAKILLQDLWMAGVDWDETLDPNICSRWLKYKLSLKELEKLKIPRWITTNSSEKLELHGFCDASEKAYAAVIYSKSYENENKAVITLLAAKSKVAPIKTKLTIPRLELCAAGLLCKLYKQVAEGIKQNTEFFAWSDSEIVLAWIRGKPKKYKTFVANRVIEIHKTLNPSQWNHVRSEDNPADLASRGLETSKLIDNSLWWQGPKWLTSNEYPRKQIDTNIECEVKTEARNFFAITEEVNPNELLQRYSSLTKATRVLAFCLRFINNLRSRSTAVMGPLSVDECEKAKRRLILLQQNSSFHKEICNLRNNLPIPKESKLVSLNPFLDSDGILRVNGRLQNSILPEEMKYPIILPSKSHFSDMVIDMAHKKTMHGGTQLTLSTIRREYWIIKGANVIKTKINNCMICQRFKTTNYQQLMGNLPKHRVTVDRPFTNTGVDYAGPIQVRALKGRGQKSYKGYIALFVCLSTKAVHIEVVSDLTTGSFLAALKRFISRRGICKNIYSDNGTNFVGAQKVLENDLKQSITEATKQAALYVVDEGIQWHFIPPATPHFGGLWEAAVKSFKQHFKRIIGETTLTFEELTTFATQIEAILNSRPLCPLTNNIEDLFVLTPGHFLIGSSLTAPPGPDLSNQKIPALERWKLVEKMTQDFWKIWSTQYLNTLQLRHKWQRQQPNPLVGQLVLLKTESLYTTKWPLARIIAIHPGKDGLVRVVTLKCRDTIMKRPISKIIPLLNKYNEDIAKEGQVITTAVVTSTTPSASTALKRKRSADISPESPDPRKSKIPPRDWLRGKGDPRVTELVDKLHKRLKLNKCISQKTSTIKTQPWIKTMLYTTTILSLIFPTNGQLVSNKDLIKITPFDFQPGIFFDEIGIANVIRSEWNLIMYYDLTNYWLEIKQLKNASKQLDLKCQNNATLLKDQTPCFVISQQVSHILSEVEDRNEILQQSQTSRRRKRAPLEIIGSISNSLFGILDQQAADNYDKQIDEIHRNQDHMSNLLHQQITISEATSNVIKRNRELIIAHYEVVQAELETVLFHEEFIDAAVQIIVAVIAFKDVQETIIDVISDVHHGRINNLLFTANQLDKQLQQIKNSLPSNLDVPTRQVVQLYKLLTIKSRVLNDKIIFEVKIPLIEREVYQILNTIPLPTLHNQQLIYIKPSASYIFVNLQRNAYYLASVMDFQSCHLIKQEHFICNIHGPLHNDKASLGSCELSLLRHEGKIPASCNIQTTLPTMVWIQLHLSNSWLFTADKRYTLDNICNSTITPITISGSGILQLPARCSLKGDSFVIHSKTSYISYTNKSFLPRFNLTHYIIKQNLPITTDITDIKNLEEAINDVKELQRTPIGINVHDIHHYSITYLLLAIVIIISIYMLCKNKCSRHNTRWAPPTTGTTV